MTGFLHAAAQSLRLLRRHKRFAALAIASLGVAIALNTTMYSVLDAMINPKLDIRKPEQLYLGEYFGDYRRRVPVAQRNHEIIEDLGFHSGVTGFTGMRTGAMLERDGQLREAKILVVLPNYFSLLGVRPSAGRLLNDADVASKAATIVLSERSWRRFFPDQRWFDGATILLNGDPMVVVGVLPYEGDYPGANTDAWISATANQLGEVPLDLFRLRDGASPQHMRVELDGLHQRIKARSGDRARYQGFRITPWIRPQFRAWDFHLALIGAVAAVLLVACANLANLQLARGVARTRELATRVAVGASRGVIVRQLLAETAWLALGGLLLGAILTAWGMRVVELSVPDTLAEYVTKPQMSWRVAAFALVATVLSLTLVGLVPALLISRVDVNTLLKSGAGTGQSRRARRQYSYLVIVEVALALTVLCAASLLTRAALTLHYTLPPEFDKIVAASVRLRPERGQEWTQFQWSEHLLDLARSVKGASIAATERWSYPSRHAVAAEDPGGTPRVFAAPQWGYDLVSADYFRLLGIEIVEGRDFSPGEFAEPQVILDQQTAKLMFPGSSAVGKLVKLDSPHVARAPWLRVIGVARALPTRSELRDEIRSGDPRPFLRNVWVLNARDTGTVRFTEQQSFYFLQILLRTEGDGRRLALETMRTFASGRGMVVLPPRTLAQSFGPGQLREKHDFIAALFAVFGLCALALAALGVYAIVSHSVSQRTREFGVRVAVGASQRQIREMVLRDGTLLALIGIALGLLLTNETAGLLRRFLFSDYDRFDSRVYALVALGLFAVAWLASWIPARRATRIDPVEALRND